MSLDVSLLLIDNMVSLLTIGGNNIMSKKNKQKKQSKKQSKLVNPIVTKEDKAQEDKAQEDITEKRLIKSNGEPTVTVNVDKDDKLVLTKEDKEKLETVKALQAKAIQAKIDAKDAIDKAKEAIQALSGSQAIKAIKEDIEARLKAQEDVTEKALTVYQEAKDKLQSIQSEYQALTGIDKKVKASKSKAKAGNGNGKFETVVKQKDDCVNVIVTHKATKNTFEYSLYTHNGSLSKEDWLKLRHSLVSQFEKETKEDNLTLRAYLSNLKSKIETVKAIA